MRVRGRERGGVSNWAKGSTRRWRRTRRGVLLRDVGKGCRAHREGWCAKANAGGHDCADRGEVAHHTHGRGVTGDDPAYIVAACKVCNLAIGDPTVCRVRGPSIEPRTKW